MANLSQAQRDQLPAADFAGPARSFPITDQDDVDSAARLIGHADDPAAVRRRIIAIAKRKGLHLPDAWAKEAGMSEATTKSADYVITFGAAAKAMGEGRVGGYVIQFGSDATKDAEGEWFTEETDFDQEFPARASIRYNHGLDPVVGRRILAHGSMKKDDLGVWVEAQLNLADRHQSAMYGMAKAGKLGWSSGAVQHITDPPREHPGGAIKSWPGIAHDCSLTPMPSDKRNFAVALKSWEPPPLEELASDPGMRSASLAEATERVTETLEILVGDYRAHAMKAGRKLSKARRERLARVRELIDEMLSETEPHDADSDESAPPPVTGEGAAGTPGAAALEKASAAGLNGSLSMPLPDVGDLYAALIQQEDRGLSPIGR